MTWSLELYQQANARLHRQGQQNAVQVHRILASGTVDEDIIRSLENKNTGQADLLDAIKMHIFNRR
jgi:SNF2 family DNA or RNA helicase